DGMGHQPGPLGGQPLERGGGVVGNSRHWPLMHARGDRASQSDVTHLRPRRETLPDEAMGAGGTTRDIGAPPAAGLVFAAAHGGKLAEVTVSLAAGRALGTTDGTQRSAADLPGETAGAKVFRETVSQTAAGDGGADLVAADQRDRPRMAFAVDAGQAGAA